MLIIVETNSGQNQDQIPFSLIAKNVSLIVYNVLTELPVKNVSFQNYSNSTKNLVEILAMTVKLLKMANA